MLLILQMNEFDLTEVCWLQPLRLGRDIELDFTSSSHTWLESKLMHLLMKKVCSCAGGWCEDLS